MKTFNKKEADIKRYEKYDNKITLLLNKANDEGMNEQIHHEIFVLRAKMRRILNEHLTS